VSARPPKRGVRGRVGYSERGAYVRGWPCAGVGTFMGGGVYVEGNLLGGGFSKIWMKSDNPRHTYSGSANLAAVRYLKYSTRAYMDHSARCCTPFSTYW